MRDIFESDQAFIQFAAMLLILIGMMALILGLSCKLVNWGYCELRLVPLFGSRNDFPVALSSVNLPLAMLAIGLSSRLMTPFGWSVCLLVLSIMSIFFGWLAFSLTANPELFLAGSYNNGSPPPSGVHIESIVLNLCFCFFSALGLIYFFFPSVRKLYW